MLNESKEEKFEKKTHLGEMSDEERIAFKKLIREYEDIFEYDEEKLGRINTVKHEIIIEENQGPIAQKRYKETDEKGKFIKKEIEQLLKMGKIRESWSNWASPVTLAGKKTGNYRFCIDYRKLNNVTKSDEYPLPRIDELLEKFRKGSWFTSLNLAVGYHQVEMAEEDKEKTAFICSQGLYEYNVMPFGLKNAPGTFQRLMDKILKEYIGEFVTVYLDDIMIYSEDFEEHIEHVDKVLSKLRENNMIVKLKKCQFGLRNINFLGHIVGRDGLRPDKEKVEQIENMRRPKTVTEVRSFLGLCSYYRRFMKGFSKIAKPLLNLTRKNEKFEWKEEQQEAFDVLRTKLTENPILVYPDFSREFILITDGSKIGLGAVLAQMNEENKEVVIAYAIGRKFIVITDHAALKGLTDGKEQTGRRARWVMKLQQFDFKIVHRSGKKIKNADGLSRLRFKEKETERNENQEITKIENNKGKLRYIKFRNKWTEKELLKKLGRENKPQVIIIDGVDGLGKTSIVQNLIKEWEKQGLKVRFNTFKRRRKDKGEFHESKLETEWKFRKEVVEQINRRMLEYDEDTDIIILDKSPYCEYYYQKTKSFNRGLITPHGNHEMEKEIFRLKGTIDESIVIFLEKDGDVCWENYIGRETKKMEKSSYPTLKKNEYLDMVKMFKENQDVYKDTKRYSQIEVRNDDSSWRKVYKEIEKHQRA
ncbi:retroviral-like aspartic protease 1 [Rhizophagus irregularis DAOM 181602=DAOM 197198]|nr:retroviral-like aspartic protease 1 [Rhizophagus irregularis DAOM 181602=DAOM 197198]